MCFELAKQGRTVRVHDPAVSDLPADLARLVVGCASPEETLRGADVVVIATAWPEYRSLTPGALCELMRIPFVIDPGHFLADRLGTASHLGYFAPGIAGRAVHSSQVRRCA
jgi:UDPglucose 6-dehydrogenase